jgi:RecA/RadA recombinase
MGPNSAGALATAGGQNYLENLVAIPTGCPTINQKFFPFYNGIPLRYVTEMSGLPGTGKTSLA